MFWRTLNNNHLHLEKFSQIPYSKYIKQTKEKKMQEKERVTLGALYTDNWLMKVKINKRERIVCFNDLCQYWTYNLFFLCKIFLV